MKGKGRIALLRGVNVGGNGKAPMAALRTLAGELGLEQPRTLLASGNLVFASDESPAELEPRLEAAIAERLGVACAVLVRTAAEWREAIAANPLREAAVERPAVTLVFALRAPATEEQLDRVRATATAGERVEAVGRHAYIDFGPSVGLSKLNVARLGLATGRNWNTALKLAALTADG